MNVRGSSRNNSGSGETFRFGDLSDPTPVTNGIAGWRGFCAAYVPKKLTRSHVIVHGYNTLFHANRS
jgi:hypothetical protein